MPAHSTCPRGPVLRLCLIAALVGLTGCAVQGAIDQNSAAIAASSETIARNTSTVDALTEELTRADGLRDALQRVAGLEPELASVAALEPALTGVAGLEAALVDVAGLREPLVANSSLREPLTNLAELRSDLDEVLPLLTRMVEDGTLASLVVAAEALPALEARLSGNITAVEAVTSELEALRTDLRSIRAGLPSARGYGWIALVGALLWFGVTASGVMVGTLVAQRAARRASGGGDV